MTAVAPDAAERIRAITALLGPDIATTARQDAAWARDHQPRDCTCPWRWNHTAQAWERPEGATCGTHRWGQQ